MCGDFLSLLRLHKIFNIAPVYTNPIEGVVVILESDGRKAALFVDEFVGRQRVVVKNLKTNYRKVPCVSGATILGDGSVSLSIDVAALVRMTGHVATPARVP